MRALSLVVAGVVALALVGCDAYQQGYDQAHEKALAEDKAAAEKAATPPPTPADKAAPPSEPAPPAT